MSLIKPTADQIKDPVQLERLLTGYYDQLVAQQLPQLPDYVPQVKAITMVNFAAMRKLRGDALGNLGPRACIVTGKSTLLDGGQGEWVWDPTSAAVDNDVSVLQVSGVATGRWRLAMTASIENVKAIASLHP